MLFDINTPREVWAEYEDVKRSYTSNMNSRQYDLAIIVLSERLGLGVHPDELTDEQRKAQADAIAKHGGGRCDR